MLENAKLREEQELQIEQQIQAEAEQSELEENEYLKGQLFDSFQKLFEYGGLGLIDKLLEKNGHEDNYLKIPLILNFIYQDNFFDPWYFYSYSWQEINSLINLLINDLGFDKELLIINPHVSSFLKKDKKIIGFTHREEIKSTVELFIDEKCKIVLSPEIDNS